PGNDDAIRAVQLYTRAPADAILEGKAAAPSSQGDAEEFVELDADGNPVAKSGKAKPAPRAAKQAADKPAKTETPAAAADKAAASEPKAEDKKTEDKAAAGE